VNFGGGLGNQLFQYASARGLMKRNDLLLFDVSSYSKDYLSRHFSLGNYNIKGKLITNKIANKFFIPNTKFNKIADLLGQFRFIKEDSFFIHEQLSKKVKFLTAIHGYWQSALYFSNLRTELLEELTPKEIPVLPEWLNEKNTVAVGVRRTDYLVDTKYGFIGEKYYIEAFKLIKEKVKNPFFIIFTDDLPWCKSFFKNESFIFCEENEWSKDYLKIYLMSKCSHQIISNSSFYWWGAWLNTGLDKIVIRPAHPFNDMSLLYESHYPEDWLVVNNL
jgi:hypothetical protein